MIFIINDLNTCRKLFLKTHTVCILFFGCRVLMQIILVIIPDSFPDIN